MNQPLGSCYSHTRETASFADELACYCHQQKVNQQRSEAANSTSPGQDTPLDTMDIDSNQQHDKDPLLATFIEYEGAGASYGKETTFMDQFDQDAYASEHALNLYYPFSSRDEWELASFLLGSDLSMAAITKFLSLKLVSFDYNQ
jgi:hypothetical protein